MLLTIGMIVKNEEKYLEKCLTAIQPIRDSVDCELIITDTGSTDGTVEIAERFADNVIRFDWCNDFSAARNTALDNAHGEWFMFLDADEIFGNCDELIRFFTSGEYRKFNSASLVIRNIYDENNTSDFTFFNAARLTKRLDNTAFRGAVHETLNTYGAPVKNLGSYLEHFGYAVSDKENLRRKFERNYNLLTKKYETSKDNDPLVYSQLYDCCILGERDDEAMQYLDEGIEWAEKRGDIILAVMLCKKAYNLLAHKRYDEALDVCERYFAMDKKIRPGVITADMEILAIQGTAMYELSKYDAAQNVFLRFFDVYDSVKKGKIASAESFMMDYTASSDNCYIKYVCSLLDCALRSSGQELRKIAAYIARLPLSAYQNSVWTERLVELEMILLEKTGFADVDRCFKALGTQGQEIFADRLMQTVFYSANKPAILKELSVLRKKYASVGAVYDIYERYFNDDEITERQLSDLVQQHGFTDDADILMIAMDKGLDISCFLNSPDFDPEKCAERGYKQFYGFHKAVDNYDVGLISDAGSLAAAAGFYANCMKYTVNFKSPKPGVYLILNANRIVEKFGLVGERIKNECEAPDDDCIKAAVIMGSSVLHRREHNYKACIEDMKKAVVAYEQLAPFISSYSKEVIDEYNEYAAANSGNEMRKLVNAIKNNIRSYIAAGNIAAAQKTLNEFGGIAPNDPDIPVLQSEIDRAR